MGVLVLYALWVVVDNTTISKLFSVRRTIMSVANGFPRISGVFYSVFDPEQGSKPVAQVPDGAVKSTETSEVPHPFVSFDAIKNYIIPKKALCNRLVSVLYKKYRVIGYPVNIVGEHYERNSFTFNLAFIFPADADTSVYESIIVRTAKMLKALEEQNQYLSNRSNLIALDSAMEQMFQDLNSFSECQIPIDDSNKIDIKLIPIVESPPEIESYEVPVSTVRLSNLIDETWDPTLERIVPFINGINSVKQIADLASADYTLTKKGIQHLVHYGCVAIIGIFQFSNIYAPTSTVSDISKKEVFQDFCDYVYRPKHGFATSSKATDSVGVISSSNNGSASHRASVGTSRSDSAVNEPSLMLNAKQVLKLYTGFHTGLAFSSWCDAHRDQIQDIDLNRFLAFGILKRIIYRVHSYPLWISRRHVPEIARVREVMVDHGLDPDDAYIITNSIEKPLHFDALCTELHANRGTVSKVLKSLGEWAIIHR